MNLTATDTPTESMADLCHAAAQRIVDALHREALESDYDRFLTTYTGSPILARLSWVRNMRLRATPEWAAV